MILLNLKYLNEVSFHIAKTWDRKIEEIANKSETILVGEWIKKRNIKILVKQ